MASNLLAMTSTLIAMASSLIAMASNLVVFGRADLVLDVALEITCLDLQAIDVRAVYYVPRPIGVSSGDKDCLLQSGFLPVWLMPVLCFFVHCEGRAAGRLHGDLPKPAQTRSVPYSKGASRERCGAGTVECEGLSN